MSLFVSNLFKRTLNKASNVDLGLFSGASLLQNRGFASQKHKRIIGMAKGYRGRANRTFKAALQRVEKALQYAYRDRKQKKRDFRKLWIERINAGARQHDISYSRFISYMNNSGKFELNRKVLADLAANEPFSFKAVIDTVKVVGKRP